MQSIRKFSILFLIFIWLKFGYGLITKITCSASSKGTCMEPFCYFSKNESRPEEVIANYGCKELSKPLHKINVHLKIFVKMSSQYFQIGYFPKVDYCEFIKNVDKQNLLYNGVKLLKKKLPDAVKDCPYKEKQLQVNNLVLTQDDFEYIPSGKYKIVCIFSDDQDEKILKMTTYFKI